jgi:RNA polymerase sigma factor (TIGR02999 family)
MTQPSDVPAEPGEVSTLIERWQRGDEDALSTLMPLVYAELRRLARRYLHGERTGHTLQPTALVHEAWMRLNVDSRQLRNRAHFFAIAAHLMRQVLVDHARARGAQKRFGGAVRVELDLSTPAEESPPELLAVDQALTALERLDARKARIVELRFFAGLSIDETAELLGVSAPLVVRETRLARAWLHRALTTSGAAGTT